MFENSSAGLVMVTGDVPVTVTREEHHQSVLARYAPTPGRERGVTAELVWCAIAAGKYKGQRGIEVRLDGQRVGELTFLMSQRYAPLVTQVHAHDGRVGCEAFVAGDARGLQLTLRLPRDPEALPAFQGEPPTVVLPALVPAAATARTPTKHRKAWIVAGAVAVILFFAAIGNANDDPDPSTSAAEDTATTTETTTSTTTTTTTTTPPPTTTPAVQPPPVQPQPEPQQPTEEPAPPPPPAAEPPPERQCDPNYTGCVPVASDVDCAGGSGNGPAYVDGPVNVIGDDIYDLDRNNDGVACE
jgi:hypothetical protein